jgi:Cu/Ag efflux protein CusF
MRRLLGIGSGVLVVALLSAAAPAAGGEVRNRRNREIAPSLADFLFPWMGEQLHQAQVCPLDIRFSQPGTQALGRRTRNLALPPAEFHFPWLATEPAQSSLRPVSLHSDFRAAAPAPDEAKGVIQDVQLDKSTLILKEAKGMKTFFLPKDCKVFVNDKEAKLSDLRKGDEVSVAYEMRGPVPMTAVEIRCSRR